MKTILKIFTFILTSWCLMLPVSAQGQYTDYNSMIRRTDLLVKSYPSICKIESLVKTEGGREIRVLTIGTGRTDEKPGTAILGGVEGSYILGRELALGFASSLLNDSESEEIRELLNKTTFYIFPDVSPDASEQFFHGLKFERNVNNRSTDDDRDFNYDEDPYEDLNNDGLITLMRVSDPAGEWIEYPEDKRVMVKADLAKEEKGLYQVYSEGIDNDKDDLFNEDGEGGVNFNRNLTFNYEEFGLNAGLHPVSEPETKAVLDFLFDHFNIYITFAFGPQDNLGQPLKSSDRLDSETAGMQEASPAQERMTGRGRNRRFTSIRKSDEPINKLISDKYHEITGIKGSPVVRSSPGNFMDWSYFHYGRYSFSTPGWWFPAEKGENTEVAFLKYADEDNMDDVFVPWKEIDHPDFKGKKTETGGIRPFAIMNPPADKLEELISKHYNFLKAVAALHPELEFLDLETEDIGENIFRVSLKVHNKGVFATCPEAGESNLWTRIMRLQLEISEKQEYLSGPPVQRIPRLEGDGIAEFSWLIMGKGTVKITAGAVNTGIINTSVELR